jgi:NitT/TauT family transport system substrate-binding protein
MSNNSILRRKYLKYIGIIIGITAIGAGIQQYRQKSKKDKIELRIGYQPSTHHIAYMTAAEKGWWQQNLDEYGVQSISEFEFPSGPPEMQAMLAGDLDIAYVGATPPITAIGSGLEAAIIANVNIQGSHLVLSDKIEYTGIESLNNLKIATFPPGSIQDTILKKWLTTNGVHTETDLEIISMGPGDAVTAMAAKAVDASFLPHPYPAIIETEGYGKMILGSGSMWPHHSCCCIVAKRDLIRDYPEIVKQVILTHIQATEYNINHQDEAAEIYANKIGWNVNQVQYSLNTWDGSWLHDPHVEIGSTLEYATVHHQLGYIDHSLTEQDLFDTHLYDEVMSG